MRSILSRLPTSRAALLGGAFITAALLAACGSHPRRVNPDPEAFDATTTHARDYPAAASVTCEAARRALLSQGFFIATASEDQVSGRKNFQPAAEVHTEVEMRVVCTPGAAGGPASTAFATAVQDRYELKKVNNSASVGVGAIGSLSLPFSSSNDAMVKVGSETLTDQDFYERFFTLMERYLPAPPARRPPPPAAPPGAAGPVATPVTQASPPAARDLAPAAPQEAASPAAPAPESPPSPADAPVPPTASRG